MTTETARPDIALTIRESDGREIMTVLSGDKDSHLIGRLDRAVQATVDVALNDKHVSRRHCLIQWNDAVPGWTVRDNKSANGTRLNEELLGDAPVEIRLGDRIKVGTTLMIVSDIGFSSATIMNDPLDLAGGEDSGGVTRFIPAGFASLDDATRVVPKAAAPDPGADEATRPAPPRPTPVSADPTPVQAGPARRDPTVPPSPAPVPAPPSRPAIVASMAREATMVSLSPTSTSGALTGIAAELVSRNWLEGSKAGAMSKIARETGRTFFRVMAEDPQVRYHAEIYEHVAQSLGIELITEEKRLMDQAVPAPHLPFALASNLGAVMLASGGPERARFATVDPYDVPLRDWIRRNAGVPVDRLLVMPQIFRSALQRLKNRGEEGEGATNVLVIEIQPEEEKRISTQIDNVDVPQVVNYFLQRAFTQGASDIHIEPTEDFLLVRNRVDGILHEDTSLPAALHPEIVSRVKIISGMDVAEKRRPQDGRIGTVIRGNPIDVRVSSYPTIYGEKVVMRLLDKNALRPSPEHLGMLARDLRLLYDKLDAPFGLVMISGPTGSGKTTTLYSCLGSIDKKSKNVLTVEDPVEYRLKGVHQMQVNDKIGLTFASGLRTMLRQDPDVIMVGECRDVETAGMAIQASLTGHIVFSTIHTNDAVGVVTRLLDMGIDPFLVANALTLAIAQRLVRKICPHCKTTVSGDEIRKSLENDGVSAERLQALNIDIDPYLTYAKGTGCVHCRNTGYSGRQAVFEVFEMSNAARVAIMSPGFNADQLRHEARKSGMTTLIAHGMHMIEEGITTHAEVIRVLGETY